MKWLWPTNAAEREHLTALAFMFGCVVAGLLTHCAVSYGETAFFLFVTCMGALVALFAFHSLLAKLAAVAATMVPAAALAQWHEISIIATAACTVLSIVALAGIYRLIHSFAGGTRLEVAVAGIMLGIIWALMAPAIQSKPRRTSLPDGTEMLQEAERDRRTSFALAIFGTGGITMIYCSATLVMLSAGISVKNRIAGGDAEAASGERPAGL